MKSLNNNVHSAPVDNFCQQIMFTVLGMVTSNWVVGPNENGLTTHAVVKARGCSAETDCQALLLTAPKQYT